MWHAFGSSDPNCVSYSGIPYYYATLLQSYSHSCTVLDAYAFHDSHSYSYTDSGACDSFCACDSHSHADSHTDSLFYHVHSRLCDRARYDCSYSCFSRSSYAYAYSFRSCNS